MQMRVPIKIPRMMGMWRGLESVAKPNRGAIGRVNCPFDSRCAGSLRRVVLFVVFFEDVTEQTFLFLGRFAVRGVFSFLGGLGPRISRMRR